MRSTRILLATSLLSWAGSASASDFGSVGLIDTPTARMQEDGVFTTSLSYDNYSQSYGISYQALPWLEGTFRYTGYEDFFFWDRNYELKARLLDESEYLPAIAVGIRDIVGTSYVGSEYLVANKKIGNLDLSLGVGWGRLAGDGVVNNPLTILDDRFDSRDHATGKGGTFTASNWFAGDKVGFFGGASYQLENVPVTLLAEYNPDTYTREVASGAKSPSNNFNFGVAWDLSPGLTLTASHQNGNRFGLGLTASIGSSEKPVRYTAHPIVSDQCFAALCHLAWFKDLNQQALEMGVVINQAEMREQGAVLQLLFDRGGHRSVTDAMNRFHRASVRLLPSSVRFIDYVVREAGLEIQTVRMPAIATDFSGTPVEVEKSATLMSPRHFENSVNPPRDDFAKSDVKLSIENRIMLFDPDNPLGVQLYANAASKVQLGDGWSIKGSVGVPLVDNLEGNIRVSNSVLPHVRSEALSYMKGPEIFLGSLYAEKRGSMGQNLHYRLFGGYLEQMFAGAGGEILYQPHRSRLAFGISGAYAQQRDFDGLFGLKDYGVATGHASVYWASPFYNYDFALHAGRYLARDVGGTLEVRRTFDNGWMVGMWSTITDVPFDTFGEGSFDKGIFLRIPLESIFGGNSPAANYQTIVRPIQRDGGARLEGFSGQLWWDVRGARHDVFLRGLDD